MSHLTYEQTESYVQGENSDLDAHVVTCSHCQGEISDERALTRALANLERVAPFPEIAARLEQAFASTKRGGKEPKPHLGWVGLAACSSTLLLLVFGYQMVLALQYGGALDFLSLYSSHPDLISTYPSEALGALVESLPLLEVLLTLAFLILAAALGQQFVGGWWATPRRSPGK
jgi:hypothetical protein